MTNEFDELENMDIEEEAPKQQEEVQADSTGEREISVDEMSGSTFLKNPEPGETLKFTIKKLVMSDKTTGTGKDGSTFSIGLKKKDGEVKRYDLITEEDERFTIPSWELFYKLINGKSEVMTLAREKNNSSLNGITVEITRNLNGKYATEKPENVAKLEDISVEEAIKLVEETKKAKKEQRLYTVKCYMKNTDNSE